MEKNHAEKVLYEASFDPKVRTYHVLITVLVSVITIFGIVLTPFLALLVWVIVGKQLKAISARLLEQKLVVKRGIFFVVEKSIPLDKITDVAMTQGPIMRALGLYSLSFETAGATSQGALVSLLGVKNAAEFRETILQQKENLASSQASISSGAQTSTDESENTAATSSHDMAELVQSVKRIEALVSRIVEQK